MLNQISYAADPDQFESDDTSSTAKTIQGDEVQQHSISPEADIDWVQFELTGTENIELKTTGPTAGLRIKLFDSDLAELGQDTSVSGHPVIRANELDSGTYFMRVEAYRDDTENPAYNINLKTTIASGDAYEPNNVFSDAETLQAGVIKIQNSIIPKNDVDWFTFTLDVVEDIELKTSGPLGSLNIHLFDHNLASLNENSGFSGHPMIQINELVPGTYYVQVKNRSTGNNENPAYNVSLKTTVANGDSSEPNNRSLDATPLQAGVIKTNNSIIPANDQDWFTFELDAIENIELKTSGPTTNLRIRFYDQNLVPLADKTGFSTHPIITAEAVSPGTYFALVQNRHSSISENPGYNLTLKTTVASGDNFEADNIGANANMIGGNVSQSHSIVPANDIDWITFTVTQTDDVEIETSGPTPGLFIKLYDQNFAFLTQDNGFTNSHALISRTLNAGVYYVKIEDYNHDNENPAYNVTVSGLHIAPLPVDPAVPPVMTIIQLLLLDEEEE